MKRKMTLAPLAPGTPAPSGVMAKSYTCAGGCFLVTSQPFRLQGYAACAARSRATHGERGERALALSTVTFSTRVCFASFGFCSLICGRSACCSAQSTGSCSQAGLPAPHTPSPPSPQHQAPRRRTAPAAWCRSRPGAAPQHQRPLSAGCAGTCLLCARLLVQEPAVLAKRYGVHKAGALAPRPTPAQTHSSCWPLCRLARLPAATLCPAVPLPALRPAALDASSPPCP